MKELITSLRLVVVSTLICCVIYTLLLLAIGQLLMPWRADGSMLTDSSGKIIGSAQIAQGFTQPRYFWPRPSAVDYNATATGGSNLSPLNPALTDRARGTVERYAPAGDERIPADLVTASGSGVDPHITLDGARFQVPRVAAARGLAESEVERLISENSQVPTLRVFGGQPVVNVLRLNLALDGQSADAGR